MVLEEVDFNFHTSRVDVRRSVVFQDGRQVEQEISIRAYSLHELGKLLRQAGFRVLDVSGGLATRGQFFGAILAERHHALRSVAAELSSSAVTRSRGLASPAQRRAYSARVSKSRRTEAQWRRRVTDEWIEASIFGRAERTRNISDWQAV